MYRTFSKKNSLVEEIYNKGAPYLVKIELDETSTIVKVEDHIDYYTQNTFTFEVGEGESKKEIFKFFEENLSEEDLEYILRFTFSFLVDIGLKEDYRLLKHSIERLFFKHTEVKV